MITIKQITKKERMYLCDAVPLFGEDGLVSADETLYGKLYYEFAKFVDTDASKIHVYRRSGSLSFYRSSYVIKNIKHSNDIFVTKHKIGKMLINDTDLETIETFLNL